MPSSWSLSGSGLAPLEGWALSLSSLCKLVTKTLFLVKFQVPPKKEGQLALRAGDIVHSQETEQVVFLNHPPLAAVQHRHQQTGLPERVNREGVRALVHLVLPADVALY
jgi:hypothetical protein